MGEMSGRFEILPDPAALARHVAEWMTSAALAAKGPFRVSLSGGSTPKALYRLLASDEFSGFFPWQRVFWYWGDDRFAAAGRTGAGGARAMGGGGLAWTARGPHHHDLSGNR